MKSNVIELLKEEIKNIKQLIAVEAEWNQKLNSDNTASTILQYRKCNHSLSEDAITLDDLCVEYFNAITDYKSIEYNNDVIQSNYTESYSSKSVQQSMEEQFIEESVEPVELVSDEEIIKLADSTDNI